MNKKREINFLKMDIKALEKHIKEVEPRLNPLGLKRLYGGLGVRKAKLKELETL